MGIFCEGACGEGRFRREEAHGSAAGQAGQDDVSAARFALAGPVPRQATAPRRHALRHRPGHLRRLSQRQAGQRRSLQPRLDRLRQARLLPRLRRDRRWSATARTPWAPCWPTAGTAATSASGAARDHYGDEAPLPRPVAAGIRRRHHAIVATGPEVEGRRPARSARPTSSWAKPTTPGWSYAAGIEPGFDDGHWDAGRSAAPSVEPLVQAHPGPPVRPIAEFKAEEDHRAEAGRLRARTWARISPASPG